jgi:hypothetical protein
MNPSATAADKLIKDSMSRLPKTGGWQAEQSNDIIAAGVNVVGRDGARNDVAQI